MAEISNSEKNKAHHVIKELIEKLEISTSKLISALDSGDNSFSSKVTENWISGKSQPRSKGKQKLAEVFSKYNPEVEAYWFECDLDEIKDKIEKPSQTVHVRFEGISIDTKLLESFAKSIEGLWYCKRMAFNNGGKIARELLQIHSYQNGKLPVTYYGITSRTEHNNSTHIVEKYDGEIIAMGGLAVAILWHKHDDIIRYRSILISIPREADYSDTVYWGIVSGFSSSVQEPVSSRILLIRSKKKKFDISQMQINYLRFRELDKNDAKLEKLLSNDIKRHHVSRSEDYILAVSTYDMKEALRGYDIYQNVE